MKTALITGASTGIGAVYAERLAGRGYDLILVARDAAKLSALAARLQASTGRKVDTLRADLSVTADLRAVEQRLATDASISLLVNNAGLGAVKTLVDSTPEELDYMIAVNVTALTRLTRAVAPGLVARGGGAIINIASIVALAPELLNGTYGGSKAFVLALTQSLHHELADKGVQVQAVLPGAIGTPFWDRFGVPIDQLPAAIVMTPEDLVDAALAGFDQRELVTLPSLPDVAEFTRMDEARKALGPNLSHTKPAARYLTAA
ncbi:SDR family NAD(P)-dependent oxidoreductase [Duganella aceris]|uniref:NADP-dependent 3-hydroxy acid dehydrogenase YdfG n=1 Tax=Duganella aceris TaxID=2703883 RepID=A0ABX0FNA4_9BURK|nr:SDR family oxidoreductase [Duganella aceris]NGZ85972.1 SDR family oxidoreductase [Duganella aceris]